MVVECRVVNRNRKEGSNLLKRDPRQFHVKAAGMALSPGRSDVVLQQDLNYWQLKQKPSVSQLGFVRRGCTIMKSSFGDIHAGSGAFSNDGCWT